MMLSNVIVDVTNNSRRSFVFVVRFSRVLNETRPPRCKANLTTNCLHWRKLTRSTFDATTDCDVLFPSHPGCVDYRNYTNPTSHAAHRLFLWVLSSSTVSIHLTNFLEPLTDQSRHKLQSTVTLLTPLRQHRYLTTTDKCLLMWKLCSPVFPPL